MLGLWNFPVCSRDRSFGDRRGHDVGILVLDYQSSIGGQNEVKEGKEGHQSAGGHSGP